MRYVSAGALSGVGAASRSLLAPQTRPPGTYITFFYTGAIVALVVGIMSMVVSACLSSLPPPAFPRFSQKPSIHGLAVVVGAAVVVDLVHPVHSGHDRAVRTLL